MPRLTEAKRKQMTIRNKKIVNEFNRLYNPDLKKAAILRDVAIKYGVTEATVTKVIHRNEEQL